MSRNRMTFKQFLVCLVVIFFVLCVLLWVHPAPIHTYDASSLHTTFQIGLPDLSHLVAGR